MPPSRNALLFEQLYAQYHHPRYLVNDPLVFPHRYTAPEDQEVVALLAAAFASGNIRSINAALEKLLAVLGPSPAHWLQAHEPAALRGKFVGLQHRWVKPEDMEILAALLGAVLRRHGTLGALWRSVDQPQSEPTVEPALGRFIEAILAEPVAPLASRPRQIQREDGRVTALSSIESILLTHPGKGSACKRMHLFLRWVVRPADGIDLGLWTSFVSPARLLMPVDVHVLRLARKHRLTKCKVPNQKACHEVTAKLRKIYPEDPCRYDFSFVRQGVEVRD